MQHDNGAAAHRLAPATQLRQHLLAFIRARQHIAAAQLHLEFLSEPDEFAAQPQAAGDQLIEPRPIHGPAGSDFSQDSSRDLVYPLVLDTDGGECGPVPQFRAGTLVIPLAKLAPTMRVRRKVVGITRQLAGDYPQQVGVPLQVILRRLVELLQYVAQRGRLNVVHRCSPRTLQASVRGISANFDGTGSPRILEPRARADALNASRSKKGPALALQPARQLPLQLPAARSAAQDPGPANPARISCNASQIEEDPNRRACQHRSWCHVVLAVKAVRCSLSPPARRTRRRTSFLYSASRPSLSSSLQGEPLTAALRRARESRSPVAHGLRPNRVGPCSNWTRYMV